MSKLIPLRTIGLVGLCVLSTVALMGCSKNEPQVSSMTKPADSHASGHTEWWCAEHGVPEEECALCDASLVAGFKEKNDWCNEHNRPASQCYKCDPARLEPFAARYEAKFGKRPPAPTE